MNGPEHYLEAETLLAIADQEVSDNMAFNTGELKADILAAAQVHATLALVAASVESLQTWGGDGGDSFTSTTEETAWKEAFALTPKEGTDA